MNNTNTPSRVYGTPGGFEPRISIPLPLCVSFLATASAMAWFFSLFNDFYDPQSPKLPLTWDAGRGKTLTPT
jgi:hypothetical protein